MSRGFERETDESVSLDGIGSASTWSALCIDSGASGTPWPFPEEGLNRLSALEIASTLENLHAAALATPTLRSTRSSSRMERTTS